MLGSGQQKHYMEHNTISTNPPSRAGKVRFLFEIKSLDNFSVDYCGYWEKQKISFLPRIEITSLQYI
jgi:hypothetical protein